MHKSGNVGDGVRDGHQDEDAAEDVEQEQQRRDQDAQEGEADVAVQLLCYHLRENGLKRDYYVGIVFFKKNGPNPASFSFIFGLFKLTLLQFIQQMNVHPVSGARIRTHNLLIMSLLP